MELGLHVADFTWSGGGPQLAPSLARVATTAEDAGFTRLTVMDHFWQITGLGPPEHEMLEAYTTLGFLAAHTDRVLLHTAAPASASAPPGTRRSRSGWACRSRRRPSGSSGWRRRCRSACRCGATARSRSTAPTTTSAAR